MKKDEDRQRQPKNLHVLKACQVGRGRALLKRVWVGIWVYVSPAPYPFYQYPPRTSPYLHHISPAVYCLDLDILLVIVSCIVFDTPLRYLLETALSSVKC